MESAPTTKPTTFPDEAPAGINYLTVDPPLVDLEVTVTLHDSGRQEPSCHEAVGETCRQFSSPAGELGLYELNLSGLPGLGPMQVVRDVVAYEAPAVEIRLEHKGQGESVEVSGAEEAAGRPTLENEIGIASGLVIAGNVA